MEDCVLLLVNKPHDHRWTFQWPTSWLTDWILERLLWTLNIAHNGHNITDTKLVFVLTDTPWGKWSGHQENLQQQHVAIFQDEMACHAKRSLKALVVVTPKWEWVHLSIYEISRVTLAYQKKDGHTHTHPCIFIPKEGWACPYACTHPSSYQKKDGRGHAHPSFFWYDNN